MLFSRIDFRIFLQSTRLPILFGDILNYIHQNLQNSLLHINAKSQLFLLNMCLGELLHPFKGTLMQI